MDTITINQCLHLYTGSTFDGCIVIKDVHGEPFLISDGDEISFFITPADKNKASGSVQLRLTCSAEVMGSYPFKLQPEVTADLSGDYYYSAFIRFADGDYYQIVPDTPLKAAVPVCALSYSEKKHQINAQVPRVMVSSDYIPSLNELEAFIACVDSKDNRHPVQIRCIKGNALILIGNLSTSEMTPTELIDRIVQMAEFVGADDPYVSGFFHRDEIPEQNEHYIAVKEVYGKRFIDAEAILKTPVYAKDSDTVISSVAFDLLRQKPGRGDILRIIHNEYPERIIKDETHFNSKGCNAAARAILKEVCNNG